MARDHRYIYLCYGPSPQTPKELRYSLETLLPEIGGDASRVSIFTDRPENFRDLSVATVDFSADLAAPAEGRYHHRVKPLALARALRLYKSACALIDTDSIIREGFDARVSEALAAGAAMNAFVRADPYPDFGPFETDLPHLGRYVFDRQKSLMYNSGLIAARAEHAPLLEDAVVLIERLWAGGLKRHDIEQFAVSECFRLGGVPIRANQPRVRALLSALVEALHAAAIARALSGRRDRVQQDAGQAVQGDVELAAGLAEIAPPLKPFARAPHRP